MAASDGWLWVRMRCFEMFPVVISIVVVSLSPVLPLQYCEVDLLLVCISWKQRLR